MEIIEKLERIISGDLVISLDDAITYKTDFKRSLYNANMSIDIEKCRKDREVNTELVAEFAQLASLLNEALQRIAHDYPNALTKQEVADKKRKDESKKYQERLYSIRGM